MLLLNSGVEGVWFGSGEQGLPEEAHSFLPFFLLCTPHNLLDPQRQAIAGSLASRPWGRGAEGLTGLTGGPMSSSSTGKSGQQGPNFVPPSPSP